MSLLNNFYRIAQLLIVYAASCRIVTQLVLKAAAHESSRLSLRLLALLYKKVLGSIAIIKVGKRIAPIYMRLSAFAKIIRTKDYTNYANKMIR